MYLNYFIIASFGFLENLQKKCIPYLYLYLYSSKIKTLIKKRNIIDKTHNRKKSFLINIYV